MTRVQHKHQASIPRRCARDAGHPERAGQGEGGTTY